jgi:hypothetical protein
VNISDLSVIENPLGIKIEQPENDMLMYIYIDHMFILVLNCKVEYNGASLVNLKLKVIIA